MQPFSGDGPIIPLPQEITLRQWFAGMALQGLLANPLRYQHVTADERYTMTAYLQDCCLRANQAANDMLAQQQSTK